MKKKVGILLAVFSCIGFLNTSSVYAEDYVAESATAGTIESQFSPEQVAAWNAEADKPVVGDWKVSGDVAEAGKGTWSWRDGLICISDAKFSGVINHGHAGIVAAAPYYQATIEANKETGVAVFYGSWEKRSGQIWQVGVNTTSVAEDQKAAQWDAKQIGKPYNHDFYNVWTRKKFYCSQLVWAAYRDTSGNRADVSLNDYGAAIHPFELRDHPNTTIVYRKR